MRSTASNVVDCPSASIHFIKRDEQSLIACAASSIRATSSTAKQLTVPEIAVAVALLG